MAKLWNPGDWWLRGVRNPLGKLLRKGGLPTHEMPTSTQTSSVMELYNLKLQELLKDRVKNLKAIEFAWKAFGVFVDGLGKSYTTAGFMIGGKVADEEMTEIRSGIKGYKNREKYALEINALGIPAGTPIREEYYVPGETPITYYNSWLNDRDSILSRYKYSFFGWENISTWADDYKEFFEKLFNKIKDAESDPTAKTNLNLVYQGVMEVLSMILKEDILLRERDYHSSRFDIEGDTKNINDLSAKINAATIPINIVDIAFRRTYKVISRSSAMNQGWYFNPYRFFLELIDLNNMLSPANKLKIISDREDDFKLIEDPAKTDPTKTKDPCVMKSMKDIPIFGKYAFFESEKEIKDKKINPYHTKRLLKRLIIYLKELKRRIEDEGKLFPYLMEDDIEGWTAEEKRLLEEGEIIPGFDENGWPLEVIPPREDYIFLGKPLSQWEFTIHDDQGYILADVFDWALGIRNHANVRTVKAKRSAGKETIEFIEDMEPIIKAISINNEFDAVRDDIRDGRYHQDSLTVIDYIMATKRIGPEEWRANFEWEELGEDKLDEKKSDYDPTINDFRSKVKMKPVGKSDLVGRNVRAPTHLVPAFDKRAIKYRTEQFKHLGRRYYHEPTPGIKEAASFISQITNPELKQALQKYIGPCITTRGLSMYVIEKVVTTTKLFKDARKELVNFSREAWYDFGPRSLCVDGPRDPFNLAPHVKESFDAIEELRKKAEEAGNEWVPQK